MAEPAYGRSAAKKAVTLSINSDVLRQARALDLDLSMVLEQRLAEIVREDRARRWQEENREAIEAHKRFVEKHGIFNDIRTRL